MVPTSGSAQWEGALNAVVDLTGRTHTCSQVSVSTDSSDFVAGGTVTVHVACRVLLSDLALPGLPGSTVVQASATAPLDPYRSVG